MFEFPFIISLYYVKEPTRCVFGSIFYVFSTVHHSIELFHQPTLMHNFLYSLTICLLQYYPRHVSSINMPIFRRKNCIHTASGIVALCKRLHRTPVGSGLTHGQKNVEDNSVTNILLMNKENCALKLVDEHNSIFASCRKLDNWKWSLIFIRLNIEGEIDRTCSTRIYHSTYTQFVLSKPNLIEHWQTVCEWKGDVRYSVRCDVEGREVRLA